MSDTNKLVRATGAMGIATLSSRVLGMVREIVFAALLGQTWVASAFYFAFTIPNLFRRLLGEGALTAAFIPVFTERAEKEGTESAYEVATKVGSLLLVVCCAVSALVMAVLWLAPVLVATPPKTQLILSLTATMMPYMIFVCVAALWMAILNARGRFFVPALSPLLLNVVLIGSVFVLCPLFGNDLSKQVYGLVIGVLIGGAVQWLYQAPSLAREGYRFGFRYDPHDPAVRKVKELMIPSILGVAVFQVNVITSGVLALWVGDYVRAALNYADRLMELPMGIFGVSIATFSLPALARLAAQQKMEEFTTTLSSSLRLLWFITIPSSVGLILMAEPVIRLLFERGRFDDEATRHTAFALVFLAPGLVSYSTVNVVARAFYALQDTRTPMKIGVLAMVVNVFLACALMWPLKEGGLALANTLSSTLNAMGLFVALRGRVGEMGGKAMVASFGRTVVASTVMGVVVWLAVTKLGFETSETDLWAKIRLVVIPVGLGMGAFFVAAFVVRSPEMSELLRAWRRRSGG